MRKYEIVFIEACDVPAVMWRHIAGRISEKDKRKILLLRVWFTLGVACNRSATDLGTQLEDWSKSFFRDVCKFLPNYIQSHPEDSDIHSENRDNLKSHVLCYHSLYA